jgi:hypothetical protein
VTTVRKGVVLAGVAVLVTAMMVALPAPAATTPAKPYDFNGDGYAELVVAAPGESIEARGGGEGGAGAVTVLQGGAGGVSSRGAQEWTQDSPGVEDESENGRDFGEFFTAGDGLGSAIASGDFDRDGYADLAIGAPNEDESGAVNVLYGSAAGLTADRNQLLSQAGELPGAKERGDGFGAALAVGDFDGDDFADLAVGAPGETIGTAQGAGAVVVVRGTTDGLTTAGGVFLSQATAGVPGTAQPRDQFGGSLGVGHFDADDLADLVVGARGDTVSAHRATGSVHVFHGAVGGPRPAGSEQWTQGSPGVRGGPETGDEFGHAVAPGDFDGDGHEDLAVAAWLENKSAGAVNVLYGTPTGLSAARNQFLSQDTPGVPGVAETGTAIFALAAGDVGGSRADELIWGSFGESLGVCCSQGAVIVLPGGRRGLTGQGSVMWTQASPGIAGAAEPFDLFGASVAALQLGHDRHDDLVVGVPGENNHTGRAHVIYGSATGLTSTGSQIWSQASPGVPGAAEPNDSFGSTLGEH